MRNHYFWIWTPIVLVIGVWSVQLIVHAAAGPRAAEIALLILGIAIIALSGWSGFRYWREEKTRAITQTQSNDR